MDDRSSAPPPASRDTTAAVGTELRVVLPGPGGSTDARHALAVLKRVLAVLTHLEEAILRAQEETGEPTTWAFTHLALGSVNTILAPNIPRKGSTSSTLDRVMTKVVEGFAVAEDHEGIPDLWDKATAVAAADLAQLLGLLPPDGVELTLLRDRTPVQGVTVTRRAGEHLRVALDHRRVSIGAVTGRLDTLSRHGGFVAGLWPERGGQRVDVRFDEEHVETVQQAWGRRVSISGRIERGPDGRPLKVRMRSLDVLPDDAPPLTDLVGLDPNLTGGADPGTYLEEIRGAS